LLTECSSETQNYCLSVFKFFFFKECHISKELWLNNNSKQFYSSKAFIFTWFMSENCINGLQKKNMEQNFWINPSKISIWLSNRVTFGRINHSLSIKR
jgi:hypothetical protein